MKTSKTFITLSLLASLALLAGCGKSNETPVTETPKPVEVAKPAIEKTVPAVTNAAAAAATTATAATADVHAAASAQADSIIDQAKALISQSKYSDAFSALQKLSGMTLSDSQTALVNSLKEQIQKGLAAAVPTNAAGAVNSLLPK